MHDLPQRVLSYYGDDFSGSADVMEALSLGGTPTVLFVDPPSPEVLERYAHARAVGLAGVSRSMSNEAMKVELATVFAALRALGTPLVHYKICSTFDSSPRIGSIGLALEIGRRALDATLVPIVVGAPVLGRYCAFGNLFARSGLDSPIHRLDRHPTMSRHPTTPMDESDLRRVLAAQTDLTVGLVDVADLDGGAENVERCLERLRRENVQAAIFDTTGEQHLPLVGEALWNIASAAAMQAQQALVVGSSGVEYALTSYWKRESRIPAEPPRFEAAPVDQIVCASGSCSPVTARQIEYALGEGFTEAPIDPTQLLDRETRDTAIARVVADAKQIFRAGRSPLIHTCRGPNDPRLEEVHRRLRDGRLVTNTAQLLGDALGRILRGVIEATGVRRVAVTGGDTSGYVARRLGIEALSSWRRSAPGSPICRVHASPNDRLCEGVEIAMKGGQVGRPNYLVAVRDGVF